MSTVSQAHSKLILFGEHAAVYGYSAVGIGLPWKMEVSLYPSAVTRWNTPPLSSQHTLKLDALLLRLQQLFPELPPLEINLKSEIPLGSGFGSSGALCVALTRCLFAFLKKQDNALWQCAHELEKTFHTTPSGIDTGLSLYNRLCAFKKGPQELPICHFPPASPLHLVIGALPRESDTKSLVANLRIQKENNKEVDRHIEKLGELAEKAIQQLQLPHLLGPLATEAHQHLTALGLSTLHLNSLLGYGLSHGALGGKLSGAGGGGAYFLLSENTGAALTLAKELNSYALDQNIQHVLYPVALTL